MAVLRSALLVPVANGCWRWRDEAGRLAAATEMADGRKGRCHGLGGWRGGGKWLVEDCDRSVRVRACVWCELLGWRDRSVPCVMGQVQGTSTA